MLNPRIYRMGVVPVVLAVIVFAFSLGDQQEALRTNIVPDAFNGTHAYTAMRSLASRYPVRRPGSAGDYGVAVSVARQLRGYGFRVFTNAFRASAVDGSRTLENVLGVRAGARSGSIVIVSHRDALSSPATAGLSGTAVMLELARVLSGQALNRTLVLASTSGSDGAAGAERLAAELPRPVDAVIVLGDLADRDGRPVLAPWSNGQQVAPTGLRNTLAAALKAQTGLQAAQPGLLGQLAHLAVPMSGTEQAPFDSGGEPAVLLSLSGAPDPSPGEPTNPALMSATGRAALEAIAALQAGPPVAAPTPYLTWDGKVIPAWAVRLLVLVLILPILVVAIDGLARARRQGHPVARWTGWTAAGALPFVLAFLLVLIARATGWIAAAPPAPVEGGVVRLGGAGIALLVLLAALILIGLLGLRRLLIGFLGPGRALPPPPRPGARARRAAAHPSSSGAGSAAGVMLLMCLVSLALWVSNPFAALLVAPALHLWVWAAAETRLPLAVRSLMLLVGLAPAALVALSFASTFDVGPVGFAWSAVLLLASGAVGPLSVIEWSLVLACAISVCAIVVRAARVPRPDPLPVTIRGPVSYAGPGSLGGTESALRR